MSDEPRVLIEFTANSTRYRLVWDGTHYSLQSKPSAADSWVFNPWAVEELCAYLRHVITPL